VDNRKLPFECEKSSVDLRNYPGWTVGEEWRRYRVGSAVIEGKVTGWATTETIAAHERGDYSALPTFFFEARRFSETGEPDWDMAGGHIETREIARRLNQYAMDATTAAWDYVLGRIEACL